MQLHRASTSTRSARSCSQRRVAVNARPVARRSRAVQLNAATEEAVTNGAVQHTDAAVIDFQELSDILKMVHETDIIELELKSKKFTLNLRKKEALQAEQPVVQYIPAPAPAYAAAPAPAPAPAAPAPAAAAPAPPPTPAPQPVAPSPTKIDGIEIVSPMSGTFYKAGAPGEAPFVKAGDKVKKGQVVGIIEAMKMMNEIEAEISGEVVKVLVENGTPVTPGTPLILIRP